MYNEEENTENCVYQIENVLSGMNINYEILVGDDGSTDNTGKILDRIAQKEKNIRVFHNPRNFGKGRVYKNVFPHINGKILVTIDADLSYDPKDIPLLVRTLIEGNADIVIGSPYIREGSVKGIPFSRLFVSKLGNRILSFSIGAPLHCVTGIFRAYRKEVIRSIPIESDGKDVEVEIITKAVAMDYKLKEVPVTLTGRKIGKSKFRFRKAILPHLFLAFHNNPLLFGVSGLLFFALSFFIGLSLINEWLKGTLNPGRPLFTLLVLFFITGLQLYLMGFLSTQNTTLRKELYRLQSELQKINRTINNKIDLLLTEKMKKEKNKYFLDYTQTHCNSPKKDGCFDYLNTSRDMFCSFIKKCAFSVS